MSISMVLDPDTVPHSQDGSGSRTAKPMRNHADPDPNPQDCCNGYTKWKVKNKVARGMRPCYRVKANKRWGGKRRGTFLKSTYRRPPTTKIEQKYLLIWYRNADHQLEEAMLSFYPDQQKSLRFHHPDHDSLYYPATFRMLTSRQLNICVLKRTSLHLDQEKVKKTMFFVVVSFAWENR